MAEEKLSIDNLEEIPVEELAENAPENIPGDVGPEGEAGPEGEESSDFLDAINKAMEPEKEPEPEAEKEPEKEPEAEGEPEAEEENLSPSAKNFKKIKEDRDNARREIEQLKQKMGDGDNSAALEQVQKERDELSEQLKLTAIERHPEFRRKFEQRASKLIATAKDMVGVGLDEKIVQVLFMAEGDTRTEEMDNIFAELPVSKQARLANVVQEMDELQEERSEALNNASATYEALEETDRQSRAGFVDANHKLFDDVAVRAKNLEFLRPKEGDDEWNQEVQNRMDLARNIYTGSASGEELVLASLWAAQGPAQREALHAQVEINRRLKAQIKQMQGTTPSVTADADSSKVGEDQGFLKTLHGFMEEQ